MPNIRVKLRFGTAEIEVEGPEASVQRRIRAFQSRFAPAPAKAPAPKPAPVDGLFGVDRAAGTLAILAAVPESPAHGAPGAAVLLALLGFRRLFREDAVSAVRLSGCLEASGKPCPRLYRATKRLRDAELLTMTGSRRAASYALSERGLREAERLLEDARRAAAPR